MLSTVYVKKKVIRELQVNVKIYRIFLLDTFEFLEENSIHTEVSDKKLNF